VSESTAPSNIRPSPAPPALAAWWSHAACDIPARYFCPAYNPGCTDCAVLPQSAHKSFRPFLSSRPQTFFPRSLSKSVPVFFSRQPALPAASRRLAAPPPPPPPTTAPFSIDPRPPYPSSSLNKIEYTTVSARCAVSIAVVIP